MSMFKMALEAGWSKNLLLINKVVLVLLAVDKEEVLNDTQISVLKRAAELMASIVNTEAFLNPGTRNDSLVAPTGSEIIMYGFALRAMHQGRNQGGFDAMHSMHKYLEALQQVQVKDGMEKRELISFFGALGDALRAGIRSSPFLYFLEI